MSQLEHKRQASVRRQSRVRSKISGTKDRPRLSLRVSARHISAQIIDDTTGRTLLAATTAGNNKAASTMTDKSAWVGTELAKKAKTHKIKRVVLDRRSKLYHGRIKALADAARKEGLEF